MYVQAMAANVHHELEVRVLEGAGATSRASLLHGGRLHACTVINAATVVAGGGGGGGNTAGGDLAAVADGDTAGDVAAVAGGGDTAGDGDAQAPARHIGTQGKALELLLLLLHSCCSSAMQPRTPTAGHRAQTDRNADGQKFTCIGVQCNV